MQKSQDFKTILAAIHLPFKTVINVKILENFQEYVYSEVIYLWTVKWEVINVVFLSRDIPLNNSAIMVKWKWLRLFYSSKGTCRIDRQLKMLIHLKYLILETCLVLGINNNNFSFFGFSNLSFFVFVFTTLKKKTFIFKYF